MEWETVAIPFAAGIQPNTRARLLEQLRLLRAENVQYRLNQGPEKRAGHVSRQVKTQAPPVGLNGLVPPLAPALRTPFSPSDPGLGTSWLYGYGLMDDEVLTADTIQTSTRPQASLLFGQASRDNEVLSWDGHRLFSYASEQDQIFGVPGSKARMPALRAQPIAKDDGAQVRPDAADNGTVRTVAWITGANLRTQVTDSRTGAILHQGTYLLQTPNATRVVCVGPWTHVLCSDVTGGQLEMRSFHEAAPATVVARQIGPCTPMFDVKKVSETSFITLRHNGGLTNNLELQYHDMNGESAGGWTPDLGATLGAICSLSVNQLGNVGIAWQGILSPTVRFRVYTPGGTPASSILTYSGQTNTLRLTVADHLLPYNGDYYWSIFAEDSASSRPLVRRLLADTANTSMAVTQTRYNVRIASQAFRVGQDPFVWLATDTALQSTWFLCDMELLPVGKMCFGLAYFNPTTDLHAPPSVNFSASVPFKDRIVFHGCLSYRQRVDTRPTTQEVINQDPQPNGVFAEPSIQFYELDFLPRLRASQAGRATYFAGAQLWAYDGVELAESGFHLAPEGTVYTPGSGGSLTPGQTYRYRVDLCHKNAQNEEVRSWSIISDAITMAANNQVTLTIPTVPMTRRDAYFLVFRTEGNQTSFYRTSSRDPADAGAAANGYVANNLGAATVTFIDRLSDVALLQREYHPGNAPNWLEPLPAPACEVIAGGRDRLWLAGGELAPGRIAPSRYFQPGETPSYTPALEIQVDRGVEPITAIGFLGEIGAFFRRSTTYILDSDGPDNVLSGQWAPVRLALSDFGAISSEGLALTTAGLFFQSAAGIRLLSPGGGIVGGVGNDVDVLAIPGNYAAATVIPQHSQVRWYSRDPSKPSLVYDYTTNVWCTWTGLECAGATYWAPGTQVLLSRPTGYLWVETEGRYTDDDRPFESVVQTAHLHAGQVGDFQRFRRFALYGQCPEATPMRVRLFYDERPAHSEEMLVTFPSGSGTFNPSVWGGGSWGAGSWGDGDNVSGQDGLWFRDGTFRYRRRPHRQKCSVFSLEFSDMGGTTGTFTPIVLALELGRKGGLDRIPN